MDDPPSPVGDSLRLAGLDFITPDIGKPHRKEHGVLFKKIRTISYDSAVFHGRGFEARYSTDTGIEARVCSELNGLEPAALAALDTDRYAKLWGLASFGRVFWPLLPIRIEVKALSLEPSEEERWRAWYIGSLSEHLYRSGLPAELDLTFSGEPLAPRTAASSLNERAILLSGGGKESAVAGELLKSLGIPFSWFTSKREVGTDPAVRAIAEISGDFPLIASAEFLEFQSGYATFNKAKKKSLRRRLGHRDPQSPGKGFLSPKNKVVEACLVAEATGSRYILIGNERSANEGNGIRIGSLEVNHQYGKSYAFEREFSPFLAKYLHPGLRYASLLMPFYELQLGKIFASHRQYSSAFRSCNRRKDERAWCLECPKCAVVFLILSAFVDEEEMLPLFGADLLADPRLVKMFMDLCGRGGHKPFECVCVADEALLALHLSSKRRTTPLPSDLAAILPGAEKADELQKRILHAYNDENGLPRHWNDELRKMVERDANGVAG